MNLTLRRGEAVGLPRPNGADKTTCFYIVVGLVKPEGGMVSIDGEDVTQMCTSAHAWVSATWRKSRQSFAA